MTLVADDVMVDFGGGSGRAAFAQHWSLDRPAKSALWREIQTMIRLGCLVDSDGWLIPSLKLDADVDPMTTLIAVVPGSALRKTADDSAVEVAKLNWDVLRLEQMTADGRWIAVRLPDGRSGYVRAEQVRGPLDYRMTIARIGGALRITALVAGD